MINVTAGADGSVIINRFGDFKRKTVHHVSVFAVFSGDVVNACFVIEVAMEFVREFACANRNICHVNGIHLTHMEDDGIRREYGVGRCGASATQNLSQIVGVRKVVTGFPGPSNQFQRQTIFTRFVPSGRHRADGIAHEVHVEEVVLIVVHIISSTWNFAGAVLKLDAEGAIIVSIIG